MSAEGYYYYYYYVLLNTPAEMQMISDRKWNKEQHSRGAKSSQCE